MTSFSKIMLMICISLVCSHLLAEDGTAGMVGTPQAIAATKNKLTSKLAALKTSRQLLDSHPGYQSLIKSLNNYETAWNNQIEQGSPEALKRATQDAEMAVFSVLGQLSGLEQKIHGAIFFEKEYMALLELLSHYKNAWEFYARTGGTTAAGG